MAQGPVRTQHTFCRICESLCGLEVDVRDGSVVDIRPDAQHVGTKGFACPKGLLQHRIYGSPDRLKQPEKRIGNRWEKIGWDQALDEIGAKVALLKKHHGPDSIAMYVGTAAGFGVLHPVFAQGFMTGLGSKQMYSSATQDCANKFAVAHDMYGFPFTQPFPDLDRTRCLIIVGANPVISKWSFLEVPNPAKALQDLEARGGKVYVVDPRLTETAKAAGEHVPIRPNTDVFFFAAFLHELIKTSGVDGERVRAHMRGLEEVKALVEEWTPERAAEVTKIPAAKLREMVTTYRTAKGAALYSSTGVNMGQRGTLAFWLQEVINAASGNLDRFGGTLVGRGVIDFPAFGKKNGTLVRKDRSRIGDFGSTNDAFPGGLLADEILTPGKGQIRALFVTGGNPLITMANSGRLKEALGELELLVTLDLFKNETGSLAHYVLPCTSPLERPDLPFIFPLMLGLQREPWLQATLPVVEPPGEARDEASIYLELCKRSGAPLFGSRIAQWILEGARAIYRWVKKPRQPVVPQVLLLDLLLRLCRQLPFQALLRAPHGVKRPAHVDNDFLGKRVLTESGKVDLAPARLAAELKKVGADFEREKSQAGRFKLITRRHVNTHNSWTHNLEEFARAGTNHLYVHPDDARRMGLRDGALADVASEVALVRVPVKFSADLMRGTVALPHGWGHQGAQGLSVAAKTQGVNANLLAADGPERLDRLSGMAHLTGITVDVKPAQGPHDPTTWSGLPTASRRP